MNPDRTTARAYPYLTILQSDLAETGRQRFAALLAPITREPVKTARLLPVVVISGQRFLVLIPGMHPIDVSRLVLLGEDVSGDRNAITRALDFLFLGI